MPHPTPAENSTNVRFYLPADAPARSLAVGLALWAGAVALGAFDDVFARLGPGLDLALAVFAVAFAAACYVLDSSLRAYLDRVSLPRLALVALAGDAALATLWAAADPAELAQGAMALVVFFAAPVALAAHIPAWRALARRLRKAPARSPGARPAAT